MQEIKIFPARKFVLSIKKLAVSKHGKFGDARSPCLKNGFLADLKQENDRSFIIMTKVSAGKKRAFVIIKSGFF